jgi:hypothetical protein
VPFWTIVAVAMPYRLHGYALAVSMWERCIFCRGSTFSSEHIHCDSTTALIVAVSRVSLAGLRARTAAKPYMQMRAAQQRSRIDMTRDPRAGDRIVVERPDGCIPCPE